MYNYGRQYQTCILYVIENDIWRELLKYKI